MISITPLMRQHFIVHYIIVPSNGRWIVSIELLIYCIKYQMKFNVLKPARFIRHSNLSA